MNTNDKNQTESENPYDPNKDPDADPNQLDSREPAKQPSQAEGEDKERD